MFVAPAVLMPWTWSQAESAPASSSAARQRASLCLCMADPVRTCPDRTTTGDAVAAAAAELGDLLEHPLATLERVRVCKRGGERLAEPTHLPGTDESGLPVWQKLMVYTGEHAKAGGRPLYVELIRRLREAGAGGATALRGMWGYYGDHEPHGDRLLSLQRRVPVLTVIVDTPENIRRWFAVVDEVTAETGLVTSELVPAARAVGPDIRRGTLRLARWSH